MSVFSNDLQEGLEECYRVNLAWRYETRVHQWQSPEDMLRDFITQLDDEVRHAVTVDWLMAALTQGRGILLLDGLDEVGRREERQRLRDQVVLPLLQRMLESLAVLTSRLVGYDEVAFDTPLEALVFPNAPCGLRRCYLASCNDKEIEQFDAAERWSQQLETWVTQRGHLEWSEQQIIDIVTLGSDYPAVCVWAAEPLPWHVCFEEAFDINRVDACTPTLVLIQHQSARHLLLAQLSMIYAVNRLHIIPHVLWVRSMEPPYRPCSNASSCRTGRSMAAARVVRPSTSSVPFFPRQTTGAVCPCGGDAGP